MQRSIAFFLLLLCCHGFLHAQFALHLVFSKQDSLIYYESKKYRLKSDYDNPTKADKALRDLLLKFYGDGYVVASIDSSNDTANSRTAYMSIGKRYEWVELREGNADASILNQVGFKEKQYKNKYFKHQELESLLRDIVNYCEDNGYPFASVKLDSVEIAENLISAAISLKRNQLIVYDTLTISGEANIRKSYLYAYLGIRPGNLYDESEVVRISKRISELTFLMEERAPEVTFMGDKARINLYLDNKKASQFDILIGLLPNNAITGRVLFTGDVNLNLVNPFGLGHIIGLNWKKLQAGTQDLLINFEYPYVASLPIGFDAKFHLYKRDTMYLDVDYQVGLQYQFAGRSFVRAYVHNKLTNVLNVDTTFILSNRQLPEISDLRTNLFGLEYYLERYDYRFNPRKGFAARIGGAAGTRKVKRNNTIEQLDDPEQTGQTFAFLYDSLQLNNVQYRLSYTLDKYWPLGKRMAIRTATTGSALISKDIFFNELYRIGGNKLLRGFDEESIFASLYNVVTTEFRFLLQRNSYFNAFFDAAYVENRTRGQYSNEFPFGFGLGVSYETKAGVFGISYAMGGRENNPVNFRNGKIHFGYVNYF